MAGPGHDLRQAEAVLLGETPESGWNPDTVRSTGSWNWSLTGAGVCPYVASKNPERVKRARTWLLDRINLELRGGAGICGDEWGGGYADAIAGGMMIVGGHASKISDHAVAEKVGKWLGSYLHLSALFALPFQGSLIVVSPGQRARSNHFPFRDVSLQLASHHRELYQGSSGAWRGPSPVSVRNITGYETLRRHRYATQIFGVVPWASRWARTSEIAPDDLNSALAVARTRFPLILRAYEDGSKASWFPTSETWDAPQPAAVYDASTGRMETAHPVPRGVSAGIDTQWWSHGDTNTVAEEDGWLVARLSVTSTANTPRSVMVRRVELPLSRPVMQIEIGPHGASVVPIGGAAPAPTPTPTPTPPPTGGPMPTPTPKPGARSERQQLGIDAAKVAGEAHRGERAGGWPDGWLSWASVHFGVTESELREWFEGRGTP